MNNKIYNDNIKLERIILILLCIIIPLAPFIAVYLIITWKPDNSTYGQVVNKRIETQTRSMWFTGMGKSNYYITVGTKDLMVSRDIYKSLTEGNFISAAYRKNLLYYYTINK